MSKVDKMPSKGVDRVEGVLRVYGVSYKDIGEAPSGGVQVEILDSSNPWAENGDKVVFDKVPDDEAGVKALVRSKLREIGISLEER